MRLENRCMCFEQLMWRPRQESRRIEEWWRWTLVFLCVCVCVCVWCVCVCVCVCGVWCVVRDVICPLTSLSSTVPASSLFAQNFSWNLPLPAAAYVSLLLQSNFDFLGLTWKCYFCKTFSFFVERLVCIWRWNLFLAGVYRNSVSVLCIK